ELWGLSPRFSETWHHYCRYHRRKTLPASDLRQGCAAFAYPLLPGQRVSNGHQLPGSTVSIVDTVRDDVGSADVTSPPRRPACSKNPSRPPPAAAARALRYSPRRLRAAMSGASRFSRRTRQEAPRSREEVVSLPPPLLCWFVPCAAAANKSSAAIARADFLRS